MHELFLQSGAIPDNVAAAVVSAIGLVVAAWLGRVSYQISKTQKQTGAIHDSINGRPTSLSDRLDEFKSEILQEMRRQTSGIREDIQTLYRADTELRKEMADDRDSLSVHIRESKH